MRIVLISLLLIHGIIHLFGFLKAFNLVHFNAIQQNISKPFGLVWLISATLLLITAISILFNFKWFWVIGVVAVLISQGIIIYYWSDAKFGTILNVLILIAILLSSSALNFKSKVISERTEMRKASQKGMSLPIDLEKIHVLPVPVQKWLSKTKATEFLVPETIYLTQELELKMTPKQEKWIKEKADQYFTVAPPAFNWSIDAKMMAILNIVGRDKFVDGKGEMEIRLLSLFPVAHAKDNPKTNQATLQRFLAEMVWFPGAMLGKQISWKELDNLSAEATLTVNKTKASGVFHFTEDGLFHFFEADRFKDQNDDKTSKWIVEALKHEEKNGILLPTELEASWVNENKKWTWLKLKIKDIDYQAKVELTS